MKSSSQEKSMKTAKAAPAILRARFFCVEKLVIGAVLLSVGTAGGALADPYDDLKTQTDPTAQPKDNSVDTQDPHPVRLDAERELKAIRERREAKTAAADMKARDSRILYDRFDGSEFSKKTFIDTDFRKENFSDLSKTRHRSDTRPDDDAARSKDLFGKNADERMSDFYRREEMKRDLREKDRDMKIWRELMKPIPNMLLDWVPDKPNPLHNGGFEKEPDNGFPVPYHLNGHPNFERKVPWDGTP